MHPASIINALLLGSRKQSGICSLLKPLTEEAHKHRRGSKKRKELELVLGILVNINRCFRPIMGGGFDAILGEDVDAYVGLIKSAISQHFDIGREKA